MTKTEEYNRKISIANQELQLAITPQQKESISKRIQTLKYRIEIEKINDLIRKLN